MENIKFNGNEYQIIKTLESGGWIYYYTYNIKKDNEVTFLCKKLESGAKIEEIDPKEYPILMKKFLK